MSDLTAPRKALPLLLTETAYRAPELVSFQYIGAPLTTDNTPILRLDLKNGTTLDLPTTGEELQRLMRTLISAFGPQAIEHLRKLGWIPPEASDSPIEDSSL
jgi:hypothetical protein